MDTQTDIGVEDLTAPEVTSPTIVPAPESGQLNLPIEAGEPVVKRGRGRPRKDGTQRLDSVTQAPPRAPSSIAPAPIAPVNYDALGKIAANLWFNVGELFLGDEWRPEPDEPPIVKDAFKDYFQSAGITTIPPLWGLCLILFSYASKRVTRPTIKTRLYVAKNRLYGVYEWLKSKTLKR